MEKRFRLTLDFKAHINDEVEGLGTRQSIEYTGQFMEKIKADKNALLEYYKLLMFDRLLHICDRENIEKKFKVKDEDDIVLPLLAKLPPETAAYILRVFISPADIDRETADREKSLISDQFGSLNVIRINFFEIEGGENEK